MPVAFAVDVSAAGEAVTDLSVTIVAGSGAPARKLGRKLQLPPGTAISRVDGTISVPTSSVQTYAIRVQVFDGSARGSSVAEARFEVVEGNPVPAIGSASPSSQRVGGPAFTLTITGTGFMAASSVLWSGSPLPTTYVDPFTLTAPVPADGIAVPGTERIAVRNLPPGGGASPPLPFTVTTEQPAYTLRCPPPGAGFGDYPAPPGAGVPPFVPLAPLKTAPNPVIPRDPATGAPLLRADLAAYVADLTTAIQLGKALYWDVQAGSDARTACATCHHHAGGDVRATNQLHPGANGLWDFHGPTVYGTNFTLTAADFPFTDPLVFRDVDNVVGSQGVRSSAFGGLDAGGAERTTPVADPVFGSARQATGRNAPSAVNAVFNHRAFADGRATDAFNGVNPFGDHDGGARVWRVVDTFGSIDPTRVRIAAASLASQAVGPVVNAVEMSAAGRTLADVGAKLLPSKALARQRVSPTDGVLGALADPAGSGLATTYAALVRKAFHPQWWQSASAVSIDGKSYSLAEANFSLFWGLSIMLYEATLVSDDSPMDRYLASRVLDAATGQRVSDDPALLDPVVERLAAEGIAFPLPDGGTRPITRGDVLAGLELFEGPLPHPGAVGLPPGAGVGCGACHAGAETTSASARNVTVGVNERSAAFARAGFDLRMERMFMGVRTPAPVPPHPPPPVPAGADAITLDVPTHSVSVVGISGAAVTPRPVAINTYDVGFYNIGVRPTADDVGLGGRGPFGQPLSLAELHQQTLADPSIIKVPGGGLDCVTAEPSPPAPPPLPFAGEVLVPGTRFPLPSGALRATEPTDVAGSFKTPSLRNVELTGPYFHNGGKATLRQVIELYDDGGDFANETLTPLIRPLGLTPDQVAGLVAFLISLTDERVLYERAPFDHPELPLPLGQDATGADILATIPAVGAEGAAAPAARFLELNPFEP